jgi:hypothetical protein
MRGSPLLLLSLALALAGCSNARETLGLKRSAPDEFKVVKNAPLEIPSNFAALPPPRPGAPRPQEKQVVDDVREKLFGETSEATAPLSAAEQALLEKTATDTNKQEDIRSVIDQENNNDPESNYSVAKRLLGIGGNITDDNSVLDADAEAKRLESLKKKP